MSREVLVAEPDVRVRPARVLAVLVVVALAVAALWLQHWERERQRDVLLAAVADAEQVVQDSRRSLSGLVQYSGALLARPDLPPNRRHAVLETLARDAARFPPRVQQSHATIDSIRPLPWDPALREARADYLARLDAWTSFVAQAQRNPESLLLERRETHDEREAAAASLERLGGDARALADVVRKR